MSGLDVTSVRSRFPALDRTENGAVVAYLDGPGGTQVPDTVVEAMSSTLNQGISNLGGGFGASLAADEVMREGRRAMADFFNAAPEEVSFGQNMTSITFAMSRAVSRQWDEGDAIVLSSLDHDANFTPWARAADDHGVEVRVADFDTSTGRLQPEAVAALLDDRVKLVAVCVASNSLGTLVDVADITAAAHELGAQVYLDAVHAGPHRLIDVAAIGCDYLVASAYKFFGPHTGVLYGKLDRLAELDFYKVRPAPSDPPEKLETGTQSFESIAGVTAAVDYLAGLGEGRSRRDRLVSAFDRISRHETVLGTRFIEGISSIPKVSLFGTPEMDGSRVATFAISVEGNEPDQVAGRFASNGIYVWSGHYYAVNVMDRLGRLEDGGLIRIGFVHYNTVEEVDRALEVLERL
ncbi:MAG: cysteine desulfurase-like protein [Acidimicrobiia bacterium]